MAAPRRSASIVIPTCNRLEELERVVAAVDAEREAVDETVEIVIVDDGSTDGTGPWLDARRSRLTVVRQANAGPATARNRGAEAAVGDLLLFLGDDTVPQPGWLGAHLEEHRLFGEARPLAVIGYTTFPPDADTPFQRHVNEYGAQFGYQLIDRPLEVPFNFLYTSNLSLPRRLLLDLGGFREDFPAAAWEDIELAYRAVAGGLRIRYQPRARTLHHHRVRPRTFCLRQRTSGRSAAIFARIHPELEEFLGVRRLATRGRAAGLRLAVLIALVTVAERTSLQLPHGVYRRMLDLSYLRGLAEGLQVA